MVPMQRVTGKLPVVNGSYVSVLDGGIRVEQFSRSIAGRDTVLTFAHRMRTTAIRHLLDVRGYTDLPLGFIGLQTQ